MTNDNVLDDDQAFARGIRAFMANAKLTSVQLAEIAGASKAAVSRWKNGSRQRPSAAYILAIIEWAEANGVDWQMLKSGTYAAAPAAPAAGGAPTVDGRPVSTPFTGTREELREMLRREFPDSAAMIRDIQAKRAAEEAERAAQRDQEEPEPPPEATGLFHVS